MYAFPNLIFTSIDNYNSSREHRIPNQFKFWNIGHFRIPFILLLFAPNVKGKWVDSNFQIIDLLVQPRATPVARWNTYFCSHCRFCYTTTWTARRIFYLPHFNSLYTHKRLVLLCAPPRHRAMWLNFHAQGKSLPPSGIELGTFGL